MRRVTTTAGTTTCSKWAYPSFEWGQALGETGSESGNSVPENYADRDVTSQVGDNHSGYLDTVADQMVADT